MTIPNDAIARRRPAQVVHFVARCALVAPTLQTAKKEAAMSFDTEPFSSGSDDVPNDVVDVMTLFPVEPYGYETEEVYMVNGVPLGGSGIDEYYGEGVPIEDLASVEEDPGWSAQGPTEYELREEEEEEKRERIRKQTDDAYAMAATAWTDEEADEILDENLPSMDGVFGGGWLF